MHPKPFEYFAPRTLKEAINLLVRYKEDAKILAGGHSLIPLMKLRLAAPKYIIDINRIKGLSYIKKVKNDIRIGALTRLYDVESSKLLLHAYPILVEAAKAIGDPQVRNMGTVGGNLAHGDPANDLPPTMLALKAGFLLKGPNGTRIVKAKDFFLDLFTTALQSDEVLTEIRIPAAQGRSGGSFQKFERKAGDFAIVSVACQLTNSKDGSCQEVGIGLGAVGSTAISAANAEKVLLGRKVNDDLIVEAAAKAAEESRPTSDLRGSERYKREMVLVFTKRAIRLALERARGRSSF